MTNTTELHQGTACRKLTLLNRNQDQLLTWAGTGCLSDGLKWFRTHVCSQNFLLASVSTTTRELEACLDYFFRICVLWGQRRRRTETSSPPTSSSRSTRSCSKRRRIYA